MSVYAKKAEIWTARAERYVADNTVEWVGLSSVGPVGYPIPLLTPRMLSNSNSRC